jgi:hypothetical protein
MISRPAYDVWECGSSCFGAPSRHALVTAVCYKSCTWDRGGEMTPYNSNNSYGVGLTLLDVQATRTHALVYTHIQGYTHSSNTHTHVDTPLPGSLRHITQKAEDNAAAAAAAAATKCQSGQASRVAYTPSSWREVDTCIHLPRTLCGCSPCQAARALAHTAAVRLTTRSTGLAAHTRPFQCHSNSTWLMAAAHSRLQHTPTPQSTPATDAWLRQQPPRQHPYNVPTTNPKHLNN